MKILSESAGLFPVDHAGLERESGEKSKQWEPGWEIREREAQMCTYRIHLHGGACLVEM